MHSLHQLYWTFNACGDVHEATDLILTKTSEHHTLEQALAGQVAKDFRERVLTGQFDVPICAHYQKTAGCQLMNEEF